MLLIESCRNMIQFIESQSERVIDVKVLMAKFAVDNVGSCAFGLEPSAFKSSANALMKVSHDMSPPGILTDLKQIAAVFFPALRKIFRTT